MLFKTTSLYARTKIALQLLLRMKKYYVNSQKGKKTEQSIQIYVSYPCSPREEQVEVGIRMRP